MKILALTILFILMFFRIKGTPSALSKTVRYTGDISTACEDWESMIKQVIVYDKKEEF